MLYSKFKQKLIIIIFIVCIFVIPIIFYISKPILEFNGYTFDIDIGEKRQKNKFIFSNNIDKLGKNIEEYYVDRIPFRNYLINIKRNIDLLFNYNNIVSIFSKKNLSLNQIKNVNLNNKYINNAFIEIDPYDDNYPAKYSYNNLVIFGQSNWLYMNDQNIMDIYTNKVNIPNNYFYEVCEEIKKINKIAKEKKYEVYFLIAPEKQEVYEEYMPTIDKVNVENNFPEKLIEYVKNNSNIDILYPRALIKNMKNKYRMYKKYDSHWNQISAYTVVNEIYKKMGLSLPDLASQEIDFVEEGGMTETGISPDRRDLVLLSNFDYKNFPTTYEYDIKYNCNDKKNIDSKFKKSLCVICDSFGRDMYNLMFKDFDTHYFVHGVDELPQNKGVEYIKYFDIIVYEVAERSILKYFLPNLIKIRTAMESYK